jgi:hypothetical protein
VVLTAEQRRIKNTTTCGLGTAKNMDYWPAARDREMTSNGGVSINPMSNVSHSLAGAILSVLYFPEWLSTAARVWPSHLLYAACSVARGNPD